MYSDIIHQSNHALKPVSSGQTVHRPYFSTLLHNYVSLNGPNKIKKLEKFKLVQLKKSVFVRFFLVSESLLMFFDVYHGPIQV